MSRQRGGWNKKTIEQHHRHGTYRADRHSPDREPRRQVLQLDREPGNVHGWPGIVEISYLLGLSLPTIRKWIKAGKIPPPSLTIDRGLQIWHPATLYGWIDAGCPPWEAEE